MFFWGKVLDAKAELREGISSEVIFSLQKDVHQLSLFWSPPLTPPILHCTWFFKGSRWQIVMSSLDVLISFMHILTVASSTLVH